MVVFGSFSTGLCDKGSDLDLVAFIPPLKSVSREEEVIILQHIKRLVFSRGVIIARGRVPILKNIPGFFRFPCDFDLSLNRSLGVFNSALLCGYLYNTVLQFTFIEYATMAPNIMGPLLSLIKSWSKGVGINHSHTGWLNSFAVTCMLLFYLQISAGLPNLQVSYIFLVNTENIGRGTY